MAGVYAPHSGITAIDGSSSTAAAARQQQHGSSTAAAAARRTARPAAPPHAGSPHADHRRRQIAPARGAAAQKPLDFSNGFEKILIGFLKSFWKVWKKFGAGFALR